MVHFSLTLCLHFFISLLNVDAMSLGSKRSVFHREDASYGPRQSKSHNPSLLFQLLGEDNFIGDLMSIEDPMTGAKSGKLLSQPDKRTTKQIEQDVNNLFAKDKILPSSKIGQKLKRSLSKLLTQFTQCSVTFEWKDLGDRFWPRYIREGTCSQEKSCSFPAGMGCKPTEKSHLTLLRHFCGARRWGKAEVEPFNAASNCRWISVKYPIVTKCSCSCNSHKLM
jgi:noggin